MHQALSEANCHVSHCHSEQYLKNWIRSTHLVTPARQYQVGLFRCFPLVFDAFVDNFLYHYVRRDMLLPVVSSVCAFCAFLYCFSTVGLLRFSTHGHPEKWFLHFGRSCYCYWSMLAVHRSDLELSDTAHRVEMNFDPGESSLLMQFTTLSATDSGCSSCSQMTRASYDPQRKPQTNTSFYQYFPAKLFKQTEMSVSIIKCKMTAKTNQQKISLSQWSSKTGLATSQNKKNIV